MSKHVKQVAKECVRRLESCNPQIEAYDFEGAVMHDYEQAKKDIIELIQSHISEIIGDAQPKPVLRVELQELIDKIKMI